MLICTVKFDKKKAVFWVIMAALVIIGIILLAGAHDRGGAAQTSRSGGSTLRTEKARIAYLAENGWEAESPAISKESVLIPRSFSPVFETYNELQKEQGFDLSEYCGLEVDLYTYRLINSGIGDDVVAMLYLYNGTVIGGDVHSTALDGFMCGVNQAN